MDGFSGGSFRHGSALPLIIPPRQQDASDASVVPASYRPSDIRAQRLAELLASIGEYRAASPAFRPYWRKLAMHDIVRFRRDHLQPERAAFEAAVARQQARRAA